MYGPVTRGHKVRSALYALRGVIKRCIKIDYYNSCKCFCVTVNHIKLLDLRMLRDRIV